MMSKYPWLLWGLQRGVRPAPVHKGARSSRGDRRGQWEGVEEEEGPLYISHGKRKWVFPIGGAH